MVKEINELRETARLLVSLIKENKLEVKVFRKPRLHAKAYIFGELGDGKSVGIIGSSNFTKAGLTTSQELNFLTDDYKIVEFEPKTENQENGRIISADAGSALTNSSRFSFDMIKASFNPVLIP